jgi:hypothetical protein
MGYLEETRFDPRWVNAVIKLIEETRTGKLRWVRQAFPAEEGPLSPYQAYSSPFDSAEYSASFGNKRFVLFTARNRPLRPIANSALYSDYGMPADTLQAFEPNGEKIMDFPALSVVEGLADAVREQVRDKEQSLLEAIEKA